ncbi:unnamed protein product [Sphenostylis stenocarpa]|uniref:Uncharacterized protein n=1 Tax=Sphenostylis stenocarpa TaxID=92480 RepID=A0AA86SH07_9FABA|nr:unnamed protein product [Sphenostylis stenocarpa]
MEQWANRKLKLLSSDPTSAKTKRNPFFEKGCEKDTILQAQPKKTHRSAMLEQQKWTRKKGA